ncbi:hypothetical protein A2U01_0078022, partial [Trifolium medium]|nr:hypothetical protein [Trifolium medium]
MSLMMGLNLMMELKGKEGLEAGGGREK